MIIGNAITLGGSGSGEVTLIDKNISVNGTYNASSDGADGYRKVVVCVPRGGGGSSEIEPAYAGLSYGYIALNSHFYSNTNRTAYVTLYEVQKNHTYVFCVKRAVSNRLRAQLFYGKSASDFLQYLTESMSNTQVFASDRNITGTTDLSGDRLCERFIVKPGQDGVLFITTSNESMEAPVYAGEYPYSLINDPVMWESGSDAEIASIIAAAHAGSIDLQADLGWEVGDVRTIQIASFTDGAGTTHPAQSVDLVITSFDDYNNCGCVMQFDFKNALANAVRMNSTGTNVGGYGSSEMKVTTLPALVSALPAWLKNLLIEFSVLASAGNASSIIETVTGNKLALRSEIELFGTATSSRAGEGSVIPYYHVERERKKAFGSGFGSGSATWWERSPYSSNSNSFCCVSSAGNANYYAASGARGVAPFGCI